MDCYIGNIAQHVPNSHMVKTNAKHMMRPYGNNHMVKTNAEHMVKTNAKHMLNTF
jgi:hypothetical protein